MSLDNVKTTVLEEAKKRAGKLLEDAKAEAERILSDAKAADERARAEAVREVKLRLDRDSARELERCQHDNRLHVLAAKNHAMEEVFKKVSGRLRGMGETERVEMVGKWLAELPADVGGVLKVKPEMVAAYTANLDKLNQSRTGKGRFTAVEGDPKVLSGAVLESDAYHIDCSFHRRIHELRETAAGDLAKVLFGK